MTLEGSRGARASWGIVGQQHAVAALRAALRQDRLSHAYLLSGPRGVGRATLARRLAQALSCEAREGVDPCLDCRACRQIEAGQWPDYHVIRVGGICDEQDHRDHASDGSTRIRICQVRRIARQSSMPQWSTTGPALGLDLGETATAQARKRVFVIDPAEDLQTEAGHALLKTLEEPPESALLVLIAGDVEELLPTIRSRCQELALRPLGRAELAAALVAEGVEPERADELALASEGRYGVARQLVQDPSLGVLRETTVADIERLVDAGRNERFDYAAALSRRWARERESVLATLDTWRDWWRRALHRGAVEHVALPWTEREAVRALRAVQRAREHLLENTNPQLALEVMLLEVPRASLGAGAGTGEENRPAVEAHAQA
jgi:DNA polymerase-3 subunit delta'